MREKIQNSMHEMKRRLTKETLYQLKKQKQKYPLAFGVLLCLLRVIDAAGDWNPQSKLRNFQPATSSPCQVLHQSQGDKPTQTAVLV